MSIVRVYHSATLFKKASDLESVSFGSGACAVTLESPEGVDLSVTLCDPYRVPATSVLFPSWLFGRDKNPVTNIRPEHSGKKGDGFLIEPMPAPYPVCCGDMIKTGEIVNLYLYWRRFVDICVDVWVIGNVFPIIADDGFCGRIHMVCVVRP